MHPGFEAAMADGARGRSPARDRPALPLLWVVPLLLTVALAPGRARAAVSLAQGGTDRPVSPQSERRRKLLEEMGLHKQEAPAPARTAAGPPGQKEEPDGNAEVTQGGSPVDPATKTSVPRRTVLPAAPSFRRIVEPLLLQTCKTCHTAGGPAKMTTFLLTGEATADHGVVVHLVDVRAPATSALLAKSSGQKPHGGGAPWPAGGAAYGRVLAWIQAGARLDGAAVSTPVPPEVSAAIPMPEAPKKSLARAMTVAVPPPVPSANGSEVVVAEAPTTTTPATTTATTAMTTAASPPAAAIDFGADVHPVLMHACAACHSPMGMAAATRLILSGEVDSDYAKVSALVRVATPARSLLVTKAAGEAHGGAVVLVAGGADSNLLVSWIAAGATRHVAPSGAGEQTSAAGGPSGGNVSPAAVSAGLGPPAASTVPVAGHDQGSLASPPSRPSSGVSLPYGLALDGRFDVAYERRGFSGDPTDGTAVNALRSYHHFLFLTRESSDDPIGLAVEITSLQFWEAHTRWRARSLPIEVVVAAGKLLVPFGADPLMHQSYGGLAGFDQRILPVIWAQTGAAVHALAHHRELALTDDLYVVRGYALRQADGIINLQNDFSAEEAVRLGWGNRVGAAWGPLSGWYSTYYNALGFGRRLVMQAGDVMLSRVRTVPVLGHFSFAAGVLRADVSGGASTGVGGPGKDYYHFGSYLQLRYHPSDWFFLQYRQGLRTFNNRRGVFVDDTRLTSDDGSTHNFAAVARLRGVTAGLYYFINLEKAGEIPDDFLRASLTYDF